jgi:hypothetical protein
MGPLSEPIPVGQTKVGDLVVEVSYGLLMLQHALYPRFVAALQAAGCSGTKLCLAEGLVAGHEPSVAPL